MQTNTNSKTEQFLAAILKPYKHCTVYNLMRLAYIIDYLAAERTGRPISGLRYRLHSFGPFDPAVFACLENLVSSGLISAKTHYTPIGLEYVTYSFEDMMSDADFQKEHLSDLSPSEYLFMREILIELLYYPERRLADMAYHSPPLKALGATPGGARGLGQKLKLTVHTQKGTP